MQTLQAQRLLIGAVTDAGARGMSALTNETAMTGVAGGKNVLRIQRWRSGDHPVPARAIRALFGNRNCPDIAGGSTCALGQLIRLIGA